MGAPRKADAVQNSDFEIAEYPYHHGLPDLVGGLAVLDELVNGDDAVLVEVHRGEDPLHVAVRVQRVVRRRRAHQLVDRVGHLDEEQTS